MKLTSWNVNGLRASPNNGLREYMLEGDADVICLPDIKAQQEQVDLNWFPGYCPVWNSAQQKGYSGTLILRRVPFHTNTRGFGIDEHYREGRLITVEFPDFYVVNVYTPNSQAELARLSYRPVSYTHLDVYKRQLPSLPVPQP